MWNRSVDADALIFKIHAAALVPDGWNSIANVLRLALNAKSALGLRVTSTPHPEPWGVLSEYDPAALTDYVNYWGLQDLWYQGAVRTGRISTGLVNVSRQLVDRNDLQRSAFFNEYLKPNGIGDMLHVCLAGSERSGFGQAALSFYRQVDDTPFTAEDMALLSLLAPHLTVAAQTYWTAQSLRMLDLTHRCALDAVTSALVGIDGSGRASFMNRSGAELIRQQQWLQIIDGELCAASIGGDATALAAALRRLSGGIGFKVLVSDQGGAQAIVRGAPLPATALVAASEGTVSLVWITPVALSADIADDLAMLFALTPAETRLIARLILGEDLRAAADSLHVSVHTARTHLKAIFAKTGKRSQAALLSFAGRVSALRTAR